MYICIVNLCYMLNKIVVIIKLLFCILFFSQNIFAQSEIIIKNFDGQIDDKIEKYYYDHESTSLYYLNSSLKLNIVDFKSNKLNIIQLGTDKDFLSTLPNNWVPNLSLNTNKEFKDSQVMTQVHRKISELTIIKCSGTLYLVDNGGGMVFKINLNDYIVERHDLSFTTMNKFGGDVFNYKNDIYHLGGYGLYSTNSTLLKYNKEYRTWDEVVVSKQFPEPNGITNHKSLIWQDEYYIIGGNSTRNQKEVKNNNLLKYNFKDKSWSDLGILNYDFTDRTIISSNKQYFFIYDATLETLFSLNVDKLELNSYTINNDKEFNSGKSPEVAKNSIIFNCYHLYDRYNLMEDLEIKSKNIAFENNSINYFMANNNTYQASIFKSYLVSDFVDLKSKVKLVLFKQNKSRNEFIIPITIVLVILILNTFYKGYKKGKDIIIQKLYSFEEGVLTFKNKEIALDENSRMILELLYSNDQVSSNDVVALLVENGMSMDYASKIKNKTIERLNEKFEFITGSTENFIQTLKSKEDKRIQVIQLIKE